MVGKVYGRYLGDFFLIDTLTETNPTHQTIRTFKKAVPISFVPYL